MIWTPKKNRNEFVSISFMPDTLTLCAVKKISSKSTSYLFELSAFTTIPFLHDEYDEGRIYNPTAIGKHITNFLLANHKKKAPIAMTLNGSSIKEEIASYHTASPFEQITHQKKQTASDYCYLYPQENGNFTFYTCAIERSIIMQYQLMAIAHNLNLQAVSTNSMANINLYRYLTGSTARHSALATILEKNNNNTASLISDQTIQNIIQIPSSIQLSPAHNDAIRIALGAITSLIKA